MREYNPPSTWPAIKDKCVAIPLDANDVLNTVNSLPRLPSESGIIDIQWKRRVGQKNCHLQAKVDPARIFRALKFLKKCGNKHYGSIQTQAQYEIRCRDEDPIGYNILFGHDTELQSSRHTAKHKENLNSQPQNCRHRAKPNLIFFPDGSAEPILELPAYLDMREEQLQEQQYIENDTIRKFQR